MNKIIVQGAGTKLLLLVFTSDFLFFIEIIYSEGKDEIKCTLLEKGEDI